MESSNLYRVNKEEDLEKLIRVLQKIRCIRH